MLHEIGHALGFTSVAGIVGDGLLPVDTEGNPQVVLRPLDFFRVGPGEGAADFTNAPRVFDPTEEQVFYDGGVFNPAGIGIAGITLGDIPLSRGETSIDMAQAAHWRDDDLLGGIYLGIMDPIENGDQSRFTANDARAFDVIGWDVVQGNGLPGEWNGITIDQFASDLNVDVTTELEVPSGGENEDPNSAEFIGNLAPALNAGDDVRRLAFEVHGYLGGVNDVDTYSFDADAGTRVWIDLDQTSLGLDSVLELISADGTVLARSDNSLLESTAGIADANATLGGIALPLSSVDFQPVDLYSYNPLDAGFNVVLPGDAGATGTYYVRVSSNTGSGVYHMQLRLEETDAIPGTTIRYADIRFADTGISIVGQPNNSQFIGDFAETTNDNDEYANAQPLGFVFNTDSGGVSVSGTLQADAPCSTNGTNSFFVGCDVDWYTFEVDYDYTDRPAGRGEPVQVIFDIDFADGFGGPDTSLWLFDDQERLVAYARDASADLVNPNDVFDLSSGSGGVFDPYLGPINLFPDTYYLAVTSAQEPVVLGNSSVRVEPLDSIKRVIDQPLFGAISDGGTYSPPISPIALSEDSELYLPPGREILDGETITIIDPTTGNSETFEFTTGSFQLVTPSGAATLDSETITVEATNGSQTFRLTNNGFTLELESTTSLVDGTVVDIQGPNGFSVSYEFDSDFNSSPFNVTIPFTPGESPEALAQRLTDAIAANGPVGAEVEGRVVRMRQAFSVVTSSDIGIEVISPIQPGEVPVFFDPSMTPAEVTQQLVDAINASGVTTGIVAGGQPNRILFGDGTTRIDLTVGSNFQIDQPIQPGNIPVQYSPSFTNVEMATAFSNAVNGVLPGVFVFPGFDGSIVLDPDLEIGIDANSNIFQNTPSAVPFDLQDVTLFVSQDFGTVGNTQSSIWTLDPYTGDLETLLNSVPHPLGDLVIRDEFSDDGTIDFHDDHLFSIT
ncbi:MAG: NF038122 family metalloprotease, partial [Planctomycetota bacterium]